MKAVYQSECEACCCQPVFLKSHQCGLGNNMHTPLLRLTQQKVNLTATKAALEGLSSL